MRVRQRMCASLMAVVMVSVWSTSGRAAIEIGEGCGYTIVVAAKANAVTRFAATELQAYVQKITGAELPLKTDGDTLSSADRLLLVGESTYTEKLGVALNDPTPEAFLLKSIGNCLVFLGDDRPEKTGNSLIPFSYFYSRKGSVFAVYEFLERFAGVRWFFPGPDGEVAPSLERLVVPAVDCRDRPEMPVRWFWLAGSLARNDVFDVPESAEAHRALWLMRLRQGMTMELGFRNGFAHAWGSLMEGNRHHADHPEYFACLNGTRQQMYTHADGTPRNSQNQVCTSQADVVRLFVERIRGMYAADADCVVSIGPNDGGGFCQCRKCRALDHPEHYGPEDGYGGKVLSDRIYSFANQVARALRKTHPRLKVGIMAYTYYNNPPATIDLLESNLRIKFVEQPESYYGNPDYRDKISRRLDEWARRVSGGILISEHYDDQLRVPVSRFLPLIVENTRFLASRQALGLSLEMHSYLPCRHLDYYVMSKLMWNSRLDAEALIADYCRRGFGQAGPIMRQYVDFMNSTFAERMRAAKASANAGAVPRLWLPADIEAGAALLDQAEAVAETDAVRRRLAFVRKGQTFLRLVRDVTAGCATMTENGLVVNMVGREGWPHLRLTGTLALPERDRIAIATRDAYRELVTFLNTHCAVPGLDPRIMWHFMSTRGDLRALPGHAAVIEGVGARLVDEGFEAGSPRGWRVDKERLTVVKDKVAAGAFAAFVNVSEDKGAGVLQRLVRQVAEGKQYVVGMTYRHEADPDALAAAANLDDAERWIEGPALVVRKRSSQHGSLLNRHGSDCRPLWIRGHTRPERRDWVAIQQVVNAPVGVGFNGLLLQLHVPKGRWWLDNIFLAEVGRAETD